MYLSKKAKAEIATRISAIITDRDLWHQSVDNYANGVDGSSYDKTQFWKQEYYRSVVNLADDFGIELCTLEYARKELEEL